MYKVKRPIRVGHALPAFVLTRTAPPVQQLFAQRTNEPRAFIIDLNYAYPGGVENAVQVLTRSISLDQIAPQYAHTVCAPRELIPLLEYDLSPIHRVWPNFSLEPLVTLTSGQSTHPQPLASGNGSVWAVLDTGINAQHQHFANQNTLQLPKGLHHRSFTGNDPLTDAFDHGTHTASIIAGQSTEASGIAPDATLLSLQVMDDEGRADSSAVIEALSHIDNVNERAGKRVIHGVNISLGYDFFPEWFAAGHTPICKAIEQLARTGVLVVIAAGNTGTYAGGITDPGNAEAALTVGSAHSQTPLSHGVSFFSATGPTRDGRAKPDLVAPGEQIIGASQDGYTPRSGTSVAAAYASGIAAALTAHAPNPGHIKHVLMRTCTHIQRDRYFQGAGFIDGAAALAHLTQT